MRFSFFNRKNHVLVNHALEIRRYDKQLTTNWAVLKTAGSMEEFETSLKLVEESIRCVKKIAEEIEPYVDLSAIDDYAAELEANVDSWREAAQARAAAAQKE